MAVDPNLANYISQRRAQGASDTLIMQELGTAGWDEVTIAEATKPVGVPMSEVSVLSSVRVVSQLDSVPHRSHKWLWILILLVLAGLSTGAWFAYGQYIKFATTPVIRDVATFTAPSAEQV